jgi:replicative DNA helicase
VSKAPKPETGFPADFACERTLLGAVLKNNDAWEQVSQLGRDDWSLESHQRIRQSMKRLRDAGSAIDELTLMNDLRSRGELEAVGGASYVLDLTEGIYRNIALEDHLRIVKDKGLLRRLLHLSSELGDRAQSQGEPGTEILSEALKRLDALAEPTGRTQNAAARAFMPRVIQEVAEDYLKKKQSAIPSGNAWFDSKAGGYRCGRYTIVAARPKIGKSPWAFTSIAYNCRRGTWVDFYSLEQDQKEVSLNLVPYLIDLPNSVCVKPHLRTPAQQEAVLEALETIQNEWPLEIHDEEMDCDQICWSMDRRARKAEQEGREILFVIDHFGLIAGGDRDIRKRYVENSERLRKKIKQHKNAALLCLFQLNEVPREFADKRPQRSDIGESKKPLQDCFAALFLHRYQDKETLKMTKKANINLELIRGGGAPGNIDCEFDYRRLEFLADAEIEYDAADWHQ